MESDIILIYIHTSILAFIHTSYIQTYTYIRIVHIYVPSVQLSPDAASRMIAQSLTEVYQCTLRAQGSGASTLASLESKVQELDMRVGPSFPGDMGPNVTVNANNPSRQQISRLFMLRDWTNELVDLCTEGLQVGRYTMRWQYILHRCMIRCMIRCRLHYADVTVDTSDRRVLCDSTTTLRGMRFPYIVVSHLMCSCLSVSDASIHICLLYVVYITTAANQ